MTITKRQFNHLNAMGINVWQQRNTLNTLETSEANDQDPLQITSLSIDSNALTQHLIFTDILQCLGLSLGEVTIEKKVINLGLFNWQFIETENISFANNTLSTPELNAFITRKTLKKDLWITIQQEVLTQ